MTLQQIRQPRVRRTGNTKKYAVITFIIMLSLISSFLFFQYINLTSKENNTEQDNTTDIVAKVRGIAILPNEEPTIATVEDVESLRKESPSVYAQAENGDKILIFSDKIYIYRESEDKIVTIVSLKTD